MVPQETNVRSHRAPRSDRPLETVRRARRALLAPLAIGAALGAARLLGLRRRRAGGEGYQVLARWPIPGGEGRFIAVAPGLTAERIRALGDRLHREFQGADAVVIMIFDDATAARRVRQGSRTVGEERFRAALAHQRAMYVKQVIRGEDRLLIYDRYPQPRAVIDY